LCLFAICLSEKSLPVRKIPLPARSNRRPSRHESDASQPPRIKPLEQYLLDAVEEMQGDRLIFTSVGAAQAASVAAARYPDAQVTCLFLDVFLADAARERCVEIPNLEIVCQPDFPDGPANVFALPLPAGAESELARDLLQTAHQQLAPGGRLFVATDNPKDHWLHEQLRTQYEKVTSRPQKDGRLYIASRPKPLRKVKTFDCWFAFRDGEQLLHACSRPGVFSHRRLDLGARALIESLTVPDGLYAGEVIHEGARVLDLGCGCGSVGFAAATRASGVRVHAMDANVRAIQCTQRGIERNGLKLHTTQLEAAGRCIEPGTWDVVLANPPYFSHFKIADVFVLSAVNAARPGASIHFVTRQPDWFVNRFRECFREVRMREIRGYYIVKAVTSTQET